MCLNGMCRRDRLLSSSVSEFQQTITNMIATQVKLVNAGRNPNMPVPMMKE